jgi:hypothetical protein
VLPAFGFSAIHVLPQCGISVTGKYNALRHKCQRFSAAMRQQIRKPLIGMLF